MFETLRGLLSNSSAAETVGMTQLFTATFLSFFLSLVVGYFYRATHSGPSYSQTTVQTMVIMAVVVSLIMMIIGTNIARAFSLVGALSIIRFRNAVKESRDVAFYFLSMGIGMACGTGFGAEAVIFTICICSMIYFMARFEIGAKPMVETLMRVAVEDKVDYENAFNEPFYKHLENADLLSVDSDGTGKLELLYTVTLRKGHQEPELLTDLHGVHGSVHAQVIRGQSNINL